MPYKPTMTKSRGTKGLDGSTRSTERVDVADEIIARHQICFGDILPYILVVCAVICGLFLVLSFVWHGLIKVVLIFGIIGAITLICISIYRIWKTFF